jgi:hypothetical protein
MAASKATAVSAIDIATDTKITLASSHRRISKPSLVAVLVRDFCAAHNIQMMMDAMRIPHPRQRSHSQHRARKQAGRGGG